MSVKTERLLSPARTMSRDQNDQLTYPVFSIGNSRPKPSNTGRLLPNTMRQNHDGTIAIFTSNSAKSGDREIFTEIPFFAIHGMQTRARDQCDVFGAYSENLGEVCDDTQAPYNYKDFQSGRITAPLLAAIIATATLQFLVGYNIVILNTPEEYVFPGHRTGVWSFAVAALAIGAPVGAILGGKLSAGRGRRFTLLLNVVVFLVGGTMQAIAPSLMLLTAARFIIGIASGIATVLVPIYLGELAPPHFRGMLGTINQFAYVTGILAADLLSFQLATEDLWRGLFFVSVVVSVIQLALTPWVVESPVWLIQKDLHDSRAVDILQRLRGYEKNDDLDLELATYIRAAKHHGQDEGETQGQILKEMMSRPHERYLFFCIVFLHTSQQLSGINAVFYYSTKLFENIIENHLIGTTLIGSVNVIFTYVALLLMDSCNRKSLLLWSMGGMVLACSTLILAQAGIFGGSTALVSVNFYVAFYEVGVGPIPWLIIAEMFGAKYVPVIMSVCSQLSWIVNFAVGVAFPTLHKTLGEFTFLPFAILLALSFIVTWVALPETQGKTPAQVIEAVKQKAASNSSSSDCDDEEVGSSCYRSWNGVVTT